MNLIQEIIDKKYNKGIQKPNYTEMAKQIGVSDVMFNHWRKNRSQPNMIWLPKIASVLGVEIKDLIDETNTRNS